MGYSWSYKNIYMHCALPCVSYVAAPTIVKGHKGEPAQDGPQKPGATKLRTLIRADWPVGRACKYVIVQGDITHMSDFIEPKPYSLLVLDLPRGLEMDVTSREFDMHFSDKQFEAAIKQFLLISTAETYRVVVFHSPDDMSLVRDILMSTCKGHVSTCVWHKTNVVASTVDKVYNAADFFTIACGSKVPGCVPLPLTLSAGASVSPSGVTTVGASVSSSVASVSSAGVTNVFLEPAVEMKLCYTTADDMVVSPYQKPVRLMKRLISLFSEEGDWVIDGCSGSGSTLVAATLLDRNVIAVDVDPRCTQYIDLRISGHMTLAGDPS